MLSPVSRANETRTECPYLNLLYPEFNKIMGLITPPSLYNSGFDFLWAFQTSATIPETELKQRGFYTLFLFSILECYTL